MPDIANIGFIGCGKIAEPMVRSLSRQFPNSNIAVSQRSESISSGLSSELDNVRSGENQWVLDVSDVIFLCLLAEVAQEELARLQFKVEHRVISVMADINLMDISQLISPAQSPCLTIPVPFIEAGNCPLPVFPQSLELERLFGSENSVMTLTDEKSMGPHFAATAILSTVMAQLDCVGNWLGSMTGDERGAEVYVLKLVSGYLNSLVADGNQRFQESMMALSTEGGLNVQLLLHNKKSGMLDVLEAGMNDLGSRLSDRINQERRD
ncbi:MAG: NAD(P)-binding domain-containing protein [Arenicella sp.]